MTRRILLATALVAGVGYFFAARMLPHGAELAACKGAGVGLLAVWALSHAHKTDGGLLALVLGLGALGDVLIETQGVEAGGIAFLAGHVVALTLYFRNRAIPAPGAATVAALVALSVAAVAWNFAGGHAALYGVGLGAMAGAAWASRFPRAVAYGAGLFVVSDLLIFARESVLAGSPLPGWLIWPTYFAAQALIAIGGVRGLSRRGAGPIWGR